MTPQDTLKQFGLEDKEIRLYIGLLELGEASVLAISRKTGVKRPTAYLILNALEKRGLVSRILKGKKLLFAAQHPKTMLTEAELRMKQLKDVIPQFEAMMHCSDEKPRVKIYEGKDALDRAFDDIFIVKGDQFFMSNMDIVHDVFARTLQKVEYSTLSPEFNVKELVDDSETSRKYAKKVSGPYRKIRFMPKTLPPFATDVGIFGNNVIITSGKKEFFSVRIESKEIADSFRAVFATMWAASSETPASN
ncbi:MAG: helix-turn-helix domain-containing protein [Patescibacteria group bacterium]